jgi:hypothetical protein
MGNNNFISENGNPRISVFVIVEREEAQFFHVDLAEIPSSTSFVQNLDLQHLDVSLLITQRRDMRYIHTFLPFIMSVTALVPMLKARMAASCARVSVDAS